jgi:Protein of unknown function (DUF1616)
VRGHGDLRLVAWGSLLCAVLALVLPWPAVSLVFAAPIALAMPGYAIVAATFAKRDLDRPRLALLSVALSLATLALGALLLNYVPAGIHGYSWAVLLLLVTLVGCRSAARRRDPKKTALRLPQLRPGRLKLVLALGGLAAAIVALVLANATLPATRALGFTELWILPVPESDRSEAQVGVRSEEQRTTEFDLGIGIGKDRVVRRSFTLAPGEDELVTIGPVPGPAGSKVPVVVTLLLDEHPFSVYRRVKGSLTASGE